MSESKIIMFTVVVLFCFFVSIVRFIHNGYFSLQILDDKIKLSEYLKNSFDFLTFQLIDLRRLKVEQELKV